MYALPRDSWRRKTRNSGYAGGVSVEFFDLERAGDVFVNLWLSSSDGHWRSNSQQEVFRGDDLRTYSAFLQPTVRELSRIMQVDRCMSKPKGYGT